MKTVLIRLTKEILLKETSKNGSHLRRKKVNIPVTVEKETNKFSEIDFNKLTTVISAMLKIKSNFKYDPHLVDFVIDTLEDVQKN